MHLVTIAYPGKPGKYGMTHLVPFDGAFDADEWEPQKESHRWVWFAHAICGVRARFNYCSAGEQPSVVECSRCLSKMREGRIR